MTGDKIKKLKEVMNNPPPERLARIEYQSHFLQIIGISAVCVMLYLKGLWYIIFAFVFGVGISYSQGVTAYRKYLTIMQFVKPESLEEFDKDISPTRRRSKIIKSVMGGVPKGISIILSLGVALMLIDPTKSRWFLMGAYPLVMFVAFIFIYFFLFFWICYPLYKRKLKKEKEIK